MDELDEQVIPMVLYCPSCFKQHIDAPDPAIGWTNPPHRSHECQFCGYTWRPADVCTAGVKVIMTKGKRDGTGILEATEKQAHANSMINHPPHYTFGKYEVIDVIEDWGLEYNDGNAVKYIARHRHKGRAIEDIEKALWYLNRHLANITKKEGT
jgi:hypothetical protein